MGFNLPASGIYGTTESFIVSPTPGQGNFQTITTAINAVPAGQTIFIADGTYDEDVTLVPGVNLVAYDPAGLTPTVILTGQVTASYAGVSSISGVQFAPSGNITGIAFGGGNDGMVLNLRNCSIIAANDSSVPAILFNPSGTGCTMNCYDCTGDLINSAAQFLLMNPADNTSIMNWYNCNFTNSQDSTTLNIVQPGILNIEGGLLQFPFQSNGGQILTYGLNWDCSAINFTTLLNNSVDPMIHTDTIFSSGSAPAYNVYPNTSTSFMVGCTINSSNSPAIVSGGGGGILAYGSLTTINLNPFDPALVLQNIQTYQLNKPATWIVHPTAGYGDFTTITAAIAASQSGQTILISPGTYTENLIVNNNITLFSEGCVSWDANGVSAPVSIVGKVTITTSGVGYFYATGIQFRTNGDYALDFEPNSSGVRVFTNCAVIANDNIAVNSADNGSPLVYFNGCYFDIPTGAFTYYTQNGGSLLQFNDCTMRNTGGSTAASDVATGSVIFRGTEVAAPLNSSGGFIGFYNSRIDVSSLSVDGISLADASLGTAEVTHSTLSTGGNSTMYIGSGCTATVTLNYLNSGNSYVIDGNITGSVLTGGNQSLAGAINTNLTVNTLNQY